MQTDYILIFVLLTLGYLATWYWNYSYYRLVNYSEQEIFFISGVAGTIILVIGEIIHSLFSGSLLYYIHCLFNDSLNLVWDKFHSLILGFAIVMVTATIFNRRNHKEKTIQALIKNNNDGLELMLLESLNDTQPLAFTLSNNKVYVGLVVSQPFSHRENRSFQILPLLSGFRRENGTLKLNTDYTSIYDDLYERKELNQMDQFSITLIVDDIVTCSYFDIAIYDKFNPGDK